VAETTAGSSGASSSLTSRSGSPGVLVTGKPSSAIPSRRTLARTSSRSPAGPALAAEVWAGSPDVLTSPLGAYGVSGFPVALQFGSGAGHAPGNTPPCVGCGASTAPPVGFNEPPLGEGSLILPRRTLTGLGHRAIGELAPRRDARTEHSVASCNRPRGLSIRWKRRCSVARPARSVPSEAAFHTQVGSRFLNRRRLRQYPLEILRFWP
jgi:hypothetical protein